MSRFFARRLVLVSTVGIAGILVLLITAAALIVFFVYVNGLKGLLAETMHDVRAYVGERGTPVNAEQFGGALAKRMFRPELSMYVYDAKHRVVVSTLNRPSGSKPQVLVFDRDRVVVNPLPTGVFARLSLALGTLFGLAPARAQFGIISLYIRANDFALASTFRVFLLGIAAADMLAVVIALVLAEIFTIQAIKPLTQVTSALERFAAGDLTPPPVPTDERHQLSALAAAYNGAIDQMKHAFAEREQAQASMQQFIADAGHQLRTPLTVIRGFIAVLRNHDDLRNSSDYGRLLDTMNAQSIVMGSLIDKLILLERWDNGERVPSELIDVGQFVEDVVTPIVEANTDRIFQLKIESGLYAAIDPSDLAHALTNLVDNAIKYTSGVIAVALRAAEPRIAIDVVDEGPGMEPEELRHAFDRFYRGAERRDVEGSGLGLAIAKRAIEVAGGEIIVTSTRASGSRFTILLPGERGRATRKDARVSRSAAPAERRNSAAAFPRSSVERGF